MVDSPGNLLKTARLSRNIHLSQVSKVTRIRVGYLVAIENNDLEKLPSPVHTRGFIRSYAEFLGLDPAEILSLLPAGLGKYSLLEGIDTHPDVSKLPKGEPQRQILQSKGSAPQSNVSIEGTHDINKILIPPADEIIEDPLTPVKDDPRPAEIIFSCIGEKFRAQREILGLSLLEVEKQSLIRRHYLEAMESGRFEELPSSVQARGMLINYARYLEFDLDEIMSLFAEGLQSQREEKYKQEQKGAVAGRSKRTGISFLRRYLSVDLIFGSTLIILIILFTLWGTSKVIDMYQSPIEKADQISISKVILTSPGLESAEPPNNATPQQAINNTPTPGQVVIGNLPATSQGQFQVYVVVLLRTWLKVTADGRTDFMGRAEAGNAYPFNGYERVEITTGDGSAIQVIYNQQDMGLMGDSGKVVTKIYTRTEIFVPTATNTPTPTISPTPTKTPRSSPTPRLVP